MAPRCPIRFGEGHDTRELCEAKLILDELTGFRLDRPDRDYGRTSPIARARASSSA